MAMRMGTAMATATATGTERLRCARPLLGAVLAVALAGATASASAETWRVVPSVRLDFTGTDNVALAPSDRKQDDYYFEIVPGLSVRGESGRLKGNLSYQLHGFVYARDSGRSDFQNSLQASGTLEAIEKWFYVDARASIAQQAISAFGPQPSGGTTNSNQAESRALQVSPYVKGQFGAIADYLLRYTYSPFSATSGIGANSWSEDWQGNVAGRTTLTQLGWAVDASDQRIHYREVRDSKSGRIQGTLQWQFDPQFRAIATGGVERNNFLTFNDKTYNTYGAGFEWSPTERTKVKALNEHRFFRRWLELRGDAPHTSLGVELSRVAQRFHQCEFAVRGGFDCGV